MIKYAIDEAGNLWCADDPNAPQQAKCPLCGVRESLRRSPLGNAFYARFPGVVHQYKDCRMLDSSVNILDILKTTPNSFWKRFQGKYPLPSDGPDPVVESENPDPPGSSVGNDDTDDPATFDAPSDSGVSDGTEMPDNTGIATGPTTEQVRGMYTLAQLAATGYLDSEDCIIGESQLLSSLTINPCFSYVLLEQQDIGNRILQGIPQMYLDRTQTIRIRVEIDRSRAGRSLRLFKTADIHIPEKTLYTKIRDKLFKQYIDDAGNTKVRKKYNRIAVAGNWTCIPKGTCHCNWACTYQGWTCKGYLRTDVLRLSWIYVFPGSSTDPEKRSKKNNNA